VAAKVVAATVNCGLDRRHSRRIGASLISWSTAPITIAPRIALGSDSSTAAKGRKASTTTPVIAPLHRLFAPETRFSALREKEPQTG
jgi:hypothetical protein